MKVFFVRAITLPLYLLAMYKKNKALDYDWNIFPEQFEIYVSMVEPITYFSCMQTHLKYETAKDAIKVMLLAKG